MTTTHSRTYPALLALAAALTIGATTLTGCSSSHPTNPTSSSNGVNHTEPKAVADAYATAWAGGDLTTACNLASGSQKQKMISENFCSGTASWHETPALTDQCPYFDGNGYEFAYTTNHEVNRFLQFAVVVQKGADGNYSVTGVANGSPGDQIMSCAIARSSSPTSASGGN